VDADEGSTRTTYKSTYVMKQLQVESTPGRPNKKSHKENSFFMALQKVFDPTGWKKPSGS